MKKSMKRLLALLLIVLIGLLSVDTKQMTANAFEERAEISQNETIEEAVNGEVVVDSEEKVEGEVTEDQDAENHDVGNVDIENQDKGDANVEVREEGKELEDSVNYEDTELNTEDTDGRAGTGTYFDLRDAFRSSGMLMNRNMSKAEELDPNKHYGSYYLYPNNTRIKIGFKDVTFTRQTVMLTSKYNFDFKAKFEIEGRIGMGIAPDGIAFAFHTNKGFKAVNTSGSLGIYYDARYNTSNRPEGGLKNAFVFEIDTFFNKDLAFGDKVAERHLEALETDGSGAYSKRLHYWKAPDTLFTKYNNPNSTQGTRFLITWLPAEQVMKIEFPDLNLSGFKKLDSAVLKDFSRFDREVYLSISTSLDMSQQLSQPIDIDIYRIEYTDLDPQISTKIFNKDGTREIAEAIPGETITVEHRFRNANTSYKSAINNKDVNFESLDIVNPDSTRKINLQTMNIQKWEYSIGGKPDTQTAFDKNNPLKVNFPSYNRDYIVRYQVKIPESLDEKENYGTTYQLKFRYLYGQKGMTQQYLEGNLPILLRPNIFSKRPNSGNNTVDDYEVYEVNVANNENEIDKTTIMTQLWEELYVQPAGYNEEKLTMNQDTSRVKVEAMYYLNGEPIDYKDIPAKLSKGNSISMRIKCTDKAKPKLICYYNRTIVFADHMSRNNQYVLYANNLPEMKETKLNTLSVEEFKKLVQTDSKAIGLKRNDDRTISTVALTVTQIGDTTNGKMDLDAKDQPHEQEISITESPNTKVKPTLKVTSNTIGVDNGVNNPDGNTAYVIIPKNITLVDKKGSQDISGNAKVFMANYTTNKKFDVFVPKTIQITNNKDKTKTININTSGGTEVGQERKIGTLNSMEKELAFNLSGNRDKTAQSGEVWNGKITFRVKAYR